MKNVKIGKNGLYVPAVGYGAWQAGKSGWGSDYTDDDLIEAMRFSIKNGSNLIDTAEVYGMGYSEKLIADAIKEFERKDYFIATKVNPPHFGYEDVLKSCFHRILPSGSFSLQGVPLHQRRRKEP